MIAVSLNIGFMLRVLNLTQKSAKRIEKTNLFPIFVTLITINHYSMKDLNIQIAIKIYEYEELNAADRELWMPPGRQLTTVMPPIRTSRWARPPGWQTISSLPEPIRRNAAYPSGLCAERTTLFYRQLPISRPGCGDTLPPPPATNAASSWKNRFPVRRLPAGDARNGKTFQTSHAHTAVRRKGIYELRSVGALLPLRSMRLPCYKTNTYLCNC